MADLAVGGAFLSAFLQVLFDRLASEEVINFFKVKKPITSLLEELNVVLLSANALLDDAEDNLIRDQRVRTWNDMLKDVIYAADELLDEIDSEVLRCRMEGDDNSASSMNKVLKNLKISTPFTSFDRATESKIKDVLRRLKTLIDQKDSLGLKDGIQDKPSQTPPAPLAEESSVYGRDNDKKAIVKLLLSNDVCDEKISVIPIVGMGGIGKTTLAQIIHNDERVKQHFEPIVWVTISDDFDVYKITKTIFERVTSQECGNLDAFGIQTKLNEALRGKKFLFIHDDVWNEKYPLWDNLKSSFQSGAHGSKIIVTTRSTIVAETMASTPQLIHQLAEVSPEYCWQLFVKYAFVNVEPEAYSDLHVIGREILKRCKGLPLAIKSLGSLLRFERDPKKWKDVLRSDLWELLEKEGEILPALWVSYRHLPARLKRCFAYFALFPKDYEFKKEKIILLWMGEGFLPPDGKGKRMEDSGEEYFQELLSRSLLQQSNEDKTTFQMHDLVHDLAISVSGEFCLRLYSNGYLMDERLDDGNGSACKTRHLSIQKEDISTHGFKGAFPKSRYLRTLLALPSMSKLIGYNVTGPIWDDLSLRLGECLRVLSLAGANITELPCDLFIRFSCLRYLDLSNNSFITEIPKSICSLYKLQTLILSCCYCLTHLPTNIGNLINLRHLDVSFVPLREMPLQICNLKKLQTLTDIVLGAEHSGTFTSKELTKIQQLRGNRLQISGLENVVDVNDLWHANFKDKKGLTEVSLRWAKVEAGNSQQEVAVLNALKPHTDLKKLKIYSYRGTRFSDWVGNHSFSRMISISLEGCENCCMLPPLGQLPSLKVLRIGGFDRVEKIDDGFFGDGPSFRSLETLILRGMHELTEWSFSEAIQEGGVFPCLRQLRLFRCRKLKVGLPAYLPSLRSLWISVCEEMVGLLPGSDQIDVVFPNLDYLEIKSCPQLQSHLQWGSHSNLRFLHLTDCEKLTENYRHWDLRNLSSLKDVWISGLEDESLPEEGLLPTTLTSLMIISCRNLECLNGKALQQLACLERLWIRDCDKLRCLSEERLPASLRSFSIRNCPLLTERCKREGEDWPKISHIPRIEIDGERINWTDWH